MQESSITTIDMIDMIDSNQADSRNAFNSELHCLFEDVTIIPKE